MYVCTFSFVCVARKVYKYCFRHNCLDFNFKILLCILQVVRSVTSCTGLQAVNGVATLNLKRLCILLAFDLGPSFCELMAKTSIAKTYKITHSNSAMSTVSMTVDQSGRVVS